MAKTDSTDREILALLKHDGRASVTTLAAALGLSRVTVQNRMKAMQSAGVILRYTVELADPSSDDLIHAVSMIEVLGARAEAVQRELRRMPQITSLYSTNGKWGLVAHSESANLGAFDLLLNRIGRIQGVLNAETCLLLTRIA
ncbi:MAG: DNA-binding Lrp family transcriptional regulator [Halocynthiibacter sp.]|jgi:DNA-binding Lrp family transcriptional regulator